VRHRLEAAALAASGNIHVPVAAWLPFAVLGLAFVVYCLVDLARHDVQHLPKWAWALICIASVPLGGILYLALGRVHR